MRRLGSSAGIVRAALVATWAATTGLGCCASDRNAAGGAASIKPARTWSVNTGARGGFTGGGSGHVITAQGQVTAWSQITPGDSITYEPVGAAAPAALAALDSALRAPHLKTLTLQETGNMTAFLEWRDPPEVRRWSWPERGGGAKLPPPLQRAVDAAAAAVRSARP